MNLTFHGGAKIVTGANYLLDDKGFKVLVDCGLFQGSKYAEDINYDPFPYEPKDISYVFLTHSHMDHVGRLPKLYKDGFRGKVIATRPTLDLIERALPDSLSHLKDEARRDNRNPIYNEDDIKFVLDLAVGIDYDKELGLAPLEVASPRSSGLAPLARARLLTGLASGTSVQFHDAGHILGSAIVEVKFDGKSIFFSGDLGNPPTPLLKPTEFIENADYVVVESAYGDRIHEDRESRKEILEDIIENTVTKGGVLMIPSFAMERTQELLFELNEMIMYKRIPPVPIFIDSPLATRLTEVYKKYPDYFNKEATHIIGSGDDIFDFPGLKFTVTTEESKSINELPSPKVIIAGSGMSQGGRILHHERRYLADPASTILFIGYQVKGSLGRQILDGKTEVKIFGEIVPVKCQVLSIGGYSAHADQPALINWVKKAKTGGKLKRTFVVQGELESSETLALKIKDEIGVDAIVPEMGNSFEIS